MATLVLSAVGTLVGGPIGGAVGALIGRQVDAKIVGSPTREGPRLTELAVSTSSYGQPVPQIHGTMRVGGSIIWATDLSESRSTSSGKGQTKTTTYSYTTSFAVALSSRPIKRVGRIWADGNLLRGAAGDLKVAGSLRVHSGHGDQPLDPLIASAESGACPAFRGCAYAVFEDLDLTDFGNRIPALSFEVSADDGEVTLPALLAMNANAARGLAGLGGFALDGGALASNLGIIDTVYPLACEASDAQLRFSDPESATAAVALPQAIAAWDEDDFGGPSGVRAARRTQSDEAPRALRYYDPVRDYQPGIQRAVGPTPTSGQPVIEFPGVLAAENAKTLTESASQRARWSRERMAWRMAELDPAIQPGTLVAVPGRPGEWLVTAWEWRERGIELELLRRRPVAARVGGEASGSANLPPDIAYAPTLLDYFELPWDGSGNPVQRQAWAAVATSGAARGATLFTTDGGTLEPVVAVPRADALVGELAAPLGPSPALMLERHSSAEVIFSSSEPDFANKSAEALASGANRLLVGDEVVQFASATPMEPSRWRLKGLLRGRGGSEAAARLGHPPGTRVVVLDDRLAAIPLGPALPVPPTRLAAIGLGDIEPAYATLRNPLASVTPLCPVHPAAAETHDGGRCWRWIRRSRGQWIWPESVEVPLVEQSESWLVGVGAVDSPVRSWQLGEPTMTLDAAAYAGLLHVAGGLPMWVRQRGSVALSRALLLEHLPPST
ncbi:phage tail protein [Erythrobacter sp. SDW2]|uniref:phage tail protein n=1 Tax=Erythrobacter sp. SDW2 TaxID=2907154 RepID=UPI001F327225|nr:phage tail protein [Erythrobacter sp. SDW2]UIP07144.1 phage tail protein [Erythrobacter sp. SDW2]